MIARVWHGGTKPEDGDAYEEFLRAKLFPGLADRVPGFRGGYEAVVVPGERSIENE